MVLSAQSANVLRSFPDLRGAGQPPLFSVTVVTSTILRPSLKKAAMSVFAQRITGRGQFLIGIDRPLGDRNIIDEVLQARPENWTVSIVDLGYSTSVRHGGLHLCQAGGSLRTIMSYAAHSRHVAYLDDDNWWDPDHLCTLLEAVQGHDWAFSLRWFVEANSDVPLAVDRWESVGPDAGVFRPRFGGFVDPNTLLLDKIACEPVLRWWSVPLLGDAKGMSEDRNVFAALRQSYRGRGTRRATCFYKMDPHDGLHAKRMNAMATDRQSQT